MKNSKEIHNDFLESVRTSEDELNNNISKLSDLVKLNKKIVNRNELFLYEIKENSVFLYEHYKLISNILSDLVKGDELNLEATCEHLANVQDNLLKIEDAFTETFKQTPEEYRRRDSKLN